MHELTEAYYGAIISKKEGVSAPRATNDSDPDSIYNRAHNRATPQTTVYVDYYDKDNKKLNSSERAARAEWYVMRKGKRNVIQVLR